MDKDEHDLLKLAAQGDLIAQRRITDILVEKAREGNEPVAWWSAEPTARLAASHGTSDDVRTLSGVLMAQAAHLKAGSDAAINRHAEAVSLIDQLADAGDEQAAAQLAILPEEVSRAAVELAANWGRGFPKPSPSAPIDIEQTHNVIQVAMLLARNGDPALQFEFDPAAWLASPTNIALTDKRNLALFAGTAPGVFEAHWFFAARGREALDLGRAVLRSMFNDHGAQVIRGLTPIECTASAWFNRQLGGKSLGIIATAHGAAELFVLAPGIIEGNTKWAS